MDRDFITIPQLAKILGISRIAVYKKVKSGKIRAKKIGKMYLIPKAYVEDILGKSLKEGDKNEIEKAVQKTVDEYGEVLRMLGKE